MVTVYGIGIKGPDAHEEKTEQVLDKIASNPVGKALLHLIKDDDDDLTIVPYTDEDEKNRGTCNAYTTPKQERHWAPKDVRPYQGNGDSLFTRNEDERDIQFSYTGTGKGSDSYLHFTGSRLGGSSCDHGRYGSAPDVVLMHEMVHALRYMQGLANPIPTKDTLYKNEEEFLAIQVANVYISASNSTLLRYGHNDHSQLPAHLITSAGFLADANNFELMSRHLLTWGPMYEALSSISVPFNPFGEVLFRRTPQRKPPPNPAPTGSPWGSPDRTWKHSKF